MGPPIPTPAYHITRVANLATILQHGHLFSNNRRLQMGIAHESIANVEIQVIRADQPVECRHGGTLHDYVPFYFCPRSPMLSAVWYNKGKPSEELEHGIVHLVSMAQAIVARGLPYCFTDGHAIMALSSTYEDLADLPKLTWDDIDAWRWKDPEVRRRKEAEFLVRDAVPWDLVTHVGVMNEEAKAQVVAALRGHGHRPQVTVEKKWYYWDRR